MAAVSVTIRFGAPESAETVPGGRIVVVLDGRIDNRSDLLPALAIESPLVADSELVARAFEKWGRDFARHLIGDFALVIHDRRSQVVYAARDPMQMRQLYWVKTADGLCIASNASRALELAGLTPDIDRLALASWLAGWPDPDRSMFANVHLLPAGHLLVADNTGVHIRKFWDIDPHHRIRYSSTDQYAAHLHEVLGRCVADRVHSTRPVIAAQLSGGMDSTTVCALASAMLHDQGRELLTVSHSYAATAECDETDRIADTAQMLGIERRILLPAEEHVSKDFADLYPPTLDNPGTVTSPRYLDEMALVKESGADVLLTGSGGDEMVWGHSLTYTQRLRRGDLGVIAEVVRGARTLDLPVLATLMQLFVRPLVPERLKRLVRQARGRPLRPGLPPWIPQQAADDLDLYRLLSPPSDVQFDNPALQARYVALKRTSTFNSVRSYEHVANGFGIDVRHPFFDRRLAEFSFAVPDDVWIRDNYPKWLLRKTMDGRLPDSVVWNRHKVTFNRFFGGVIAGQATNIRAILSDTRLQDLGLVDNGRLLAAFDRVVESGGQQLNVDLLYALLTQIWFQRHVDRFSVA